MEITTLASSSAGNCYMLDDGRAPLLIEAGIRFSDIRKGVGFGLSRLAGALISHEHLDHARAVPDLLKASVDVYASSGTIEALDIAHHRLRPLRALEQVQIGPWTVKPFDAVHDCAEPLGFLIANGASKILYLSDSAYCRYRFPGLSHLMIECNHSVELLRKSVAEGAITPEHKARVLRNHMSLSRLLAMLKANDLSQVQAIHLLHLSDTNSDEAAFKAAVMRATGRPVYVAAR